MAVIVQVVGLCRQRYQVQPYLSTAQRVIILDRTFLIYPKADIPRRWTLGGYVVYTCKVPAVVEGEGKIRVRSLKINDGICQRISAK